MTAKNVFYLMIGATVLGFLGILLAFYWGNSQLEATASVIADLRAEHDAAQEKIIALQQAEQDTQLIDETEKLLENLLPDQKNQETLVADVIYTASAEAGIPIENLGTLTFSSSGEPTNVSGTEKLKEVTGVLSYPFSMSVQNISFDTLLQLLREIETNGRLVQVDNIQINPNKSEAGEIASVSLSLKAFLKP